MSLVADVLADYDLAVPESRIAAELRVLLERGAPSQRSTASLTATEEALLRDHGGVRPASRRQLADLDARTAALAIHAATDSLSRAQVAERLGIEPSRVSHRSRDGQLYWYKGVAGRPRYPRWQFDRSSVLPHLDRVVAALPAGAHPAVVESFMTVPLESLVLHDDPISPRQWLLLGGKPDPIVLSAATLGEQL